MLEPLGVTDVDEAVYEQVLAAGATTEADLTRLTGLDAAAVADALAHLQRFGLVSRLATLEQTVVALPPALAIEALAFRRYREVDEARAASERYARLHQQRRPGDATTGYVEVIHGTAAMLQQSIQLQLGAREQLRVFDRAPYSRVKSSVEETTLLARGVRCRALYDPGGESGRWTLDVAAGEEARLATAELPMKLAIADDALALIPLLDDAYVHEPTALVVRPSNLLTALIVLFEDHWRRAAPIRVDGTVDTDTEADLPIDVGLIASLLLAGFTSDAIARQLGVTRRTLHNHIDAAKATLGVDNKYQLVLRAKELGLLD
ncbi:MAG TPA: LuxR C-terminal-related transcriptional regulator [Mycobacteriales bacterium]|nr:LuxR C-terminal-related transcriptional regulator [Mycobacteriales bacterium]